MLLFSYWLQRLAVLSKTHELPRFLTEMTEPGFKDTAPELYARLGRYLQNPPLFSDEYPQYVTEYAQTGIWIFEGLYFFRELSLFPQFKKDWLTQLEKARHRLGIEIETYIRQADAVEMIFSRAAGYISEESCTDFFNGFNFDDLPPEILFCYAVLTGNGDRAAAAGRRSDETLARLITGFRLLNYLPQLQRNRLTETEEQVNRFLQHTLFYIDPKKHFWAFAGREVRTRFIIAKMNLTDSPTDLSALRESSVRELLIESQKDIYENQVYALLQIHESLLEIYLGGLETSADIIIRQLEMVREFAESWGSSDGKVRVALHRAQYFYQNALRLKKEGKTDKKIFSYTKVNSEWREALKLTKETQNAARLPEVYIGLSEVQRLPADRAYAGWDVLCEGYRYGMKNPKHGGYRLIVKLFDFAAERAAEESHKPGVCSLTAEECGFGDYFKLQMQFMHHLCQKNEVLTQTGTRNIATYRAAFLRLAEVGTIHPRFYFLYQHAAVKMLVLGAILSNDETARLTAERLDAELSSDMNPLSVIRADWTDGKEAADKFHEILLHRTISAFKGDLKTAAERLPYNYRNLRNYVGQDTIRRLGFFERMNPGSVIESGIRMLLSEMFEERKEIEGLFDLPAFLASTTQPFEVTDLARVQGIQEASARRYAKFFVEKGLLKPDEKKKNRFTVHREAVRKAYTRFKEKYSDKEE